MWQRQDYVQHRALLSGELAQCMAVTCHPVFRSKTLDVESLDAEITSNVEYNATRKQKR